MNHWLKRQKAKTIWQRLIEDLQSGELSREQVKDMFRRLLDET